jgi:PAS domain S-box-containing protein
MQVIPVVYDQAFFAAMTVLRRLPPSTIILDRNLKSFLLSHDLNSQSEEMSLGQLIIQNSESPILLLGRTQIVETVNFSFTETFGYNPEQLLGQQFTSFISTEQKEEINKQLALIRLGQIDDYYDGHTICIAIDDVEMPCKITIIGIRKKANEEMNRYVVILRNESLVLKYQSEVEQMKQKTDELFSEILPKEIHHLFNQNEEDVIFHVKSVSIIFIDIARFCDYITSLPPNLTLEFLSRVFGAYDEMMQKYSLITKIKSIGDAYIAASGLFSPNDSHQSHVEQIVSFGLDCIQVFERINLGLNAKLSIRIGIHCDPVIAGIL